MTEFNGDVYRQPPITPTPPSSSLPRAPAVMLSTPLRFKIYKSALISVGVDEHEPEVEKSRKRRRKSSVNDDDMAKISKKPFKKHVESDDGMNEGIEKSECNDHKGNDEKDASNEAPRDNVREQNEVEHRIVTVLMSKRDKVFKSVLIPVGREEEEDELQHKDKQQPEPASPEYEFKTGNALDLPTEQEHAQEPQQTVHEPEPEPEDEPQVEIPRSDSILNLIDYETPPEITKVVKKKRSSIHVSQFIQTVHGPRKARSPTPVTVAVAATPTPPPTPADKCESTKAHRKETFEKENTYSGKKSKKNKRGSNLNKAKKQKVNKDQIPSIDLEDEENHSGAIESIDYDTTIPQSSPVSNHIARYPEQIIRSSSSRDEDDPVEEMEAQNFHVQNTTTMLMSDDATRVNHTPPHKTTTDVSDPIHSVLSLIEDAVNVRVAEMEKDCAIAEAKALAELRQHFALTRLKGRERIAREIRQSLRAYVSGTYVHGCSAQAPSSQ